MKAVKKMHQNTSGVYNNNSVPPSNNVTNRDVEIWFFVLIYDIIALIAHIHKDRQYDKMCLLLYIFSHWQYLITCLLFNTYRVG